MLEKSACLRQHDAPRPHASRAICASETSEAQRLRCRVFADERGVRFSARTPGAYNDVYDSYAWKPAAPGSIPTIAAARCPQCRRRARIGETSPGGPAKQSSID